MSEYAFTEQELNELKDAFFAEAYEILHALNEEILGLEGGQCRNGSLKAIQRGFHTLKGNARALGYASLNQLCHKAEDLLKTIQGNAVHADQELIDLLFLIHDTLKRHLDGYRAGAEAPLDGRIVKRIEDYCAAAGNGAGGDLDAEQPGTDSDICQDVEIQGRETAPAESRQDRASGPGTDETVQTLRVDAQRIDRILNLVGELIIGRSIIGQVLSELAERYHKDDLVKRLGDANAFIEKTLSLLQKNAMKIRMLPISQVFRKFPRVVRDLAREKGKEVKLVIQGEKTDLDKSILDALGEPLLHLVRNAVDHGIETPEVRERCGKPRAGSVTLSADHEGNQIIINVRDDGAGIDPERLRRKAVEKGVRTAEEAARLSDAEALNLVFLSGFSTMESVTDISGRGLGMDIVRTIVESLKGRISIQSEPGAGSVFTIKLPLTLAIIRAMLFSEDNRLFAFPMASVEKILRVKDADIQTVAGRTVLRFRDKVISVFPLREFLADSGEEAGPGAQRSIIVVAHGGAAYSAFAVDRILGQQELVIKVLENYWNTINYTAGASILGDGRVVLILDVPALVTAERARVEIAASPMTSS